MYRLLHTKLHVGEQVQLNIFAGSRNGPIKFNKHSSRLRCDTALSIGLSNRSFHPSLASQSFPSRTPTPPVHLICCQIMFTSVILQRADCARDSPNTRLILRKRDYKRASSSDGNLLVFRSFGSACARARKSFVIFFLYEGRVLGCSDFNKVGFGV